MKEYIINQFNKAGFTIEEDVAKKFVSYYTLLKEWNQKFNLTAITDFEDVVLKHFIDSAYGAKYIRGKKSLCDIGAGAGFPSIPLKLLCPEIKLTMIDSLNKRVTFLKEVVKELSLTDCKCIHARAEDAAKGALRESFEAVTARAVASLSALCEYCIPFVKTGGIFVAYKAKADGELENSRNALKLLGGKLESCQKYNLLDTDNVRTLIVIKKIKPTNKKYPRGLGKEKTQPL